MTMQKAIRPNDSAAGKKDVLVIVPRQGLPEPTPEEARLIAEHGTRVARGQREAARQQKIFEARREELLARYPGKHLAVCAGEVFVGDTDIEVAEKALRAHNGRASFFYSPGCAILSR